MPSLPGAKVMERAAWAALLRVLMVAGWSDSLVRLAFGAKLAALEPGAS